MRKASITEAKNRLSSLLDQVRQGHTILILDRNIPVARLEPVQSAPKEIAGRLERLERAGLIKRGRSVPAKFLKEPRPKLRRGTSLLGAILLERREGR